jgi:tetratricopeptide (TPR) repeat protein
MRTASLLLLLAVPVLAGGADDAKALLGKGDAAKAAETARKAAERSPADIEAWLVLADALFALDQPADAWEALEPAIEKNPTEARLSLKLGDAFVKLAEKEKVETNDGTTIVNYYLDAERNYGEAFRKDPKCAAAVYGMASVNFETGRQGAKERASELIVQCLGIDGNFAKAHALQGYMLYLDGKELAGQKKDGDAKQKYMAAGEKYALALKLGDDDVLDMVRYGHTLLAQGRLDEAKAAYLAALQKHPESNVPILSGLYHVANRGEAKPAWTNPKVKPILEEAAKEAPKSPWAWSYLGYCHALAQAWEDAVKSYGKALELDPKNANYMYQIGYMREKLGQAEKAMDAYRDALKAAPDFADPAFRFEGLIGMRTDVERAERLYEELIALATDNADVHNNYALLLRDWAEATRKATDDSPPADVKRRLKRSGEVYEIAARLAPEVAQIQSDTGLMFQFYPCNFDAKKAKAYFTRSLELSDYAYRDAFDGLAKLCQQTKDWETLADYAERVVGSMERGNHAIAPAGGGAAEALPNESPGLKARAEAALRIAQEKLKKS